MFKKYIKYFFPDLQWYNIKVSLKVNLLPRIISLKKEVKKKFFFSKNFLSQIEPVVLNKTSLFTTTCSLNELHYFKQTACFFL